MNPARGLGPASRPGPQKWGDPRGELSAEAAPPPQSGDLHNLSLQSRGASEEVTLGPTLQPPKSDTAVTLLISTNGQTTINSD